MMHFTSDLSGPNTIPEVAKLCAELDSLTSEERVRWAFERYGDELLLASSFGAEDVVLIDIAVRVSANLRIFTIDTGRLPQETYDVMEALRSRYDCTFEVYAPDTADLERLLREKGPNSFYQSVENRRECCHVRKVEPLRRALNGASAWMTGLRRAQSVTRSTVPVVAIDYDHRQILKLNPLVEWSEDEIWQRIQERDIPFNALHSKGYPSIGCAPCTRAVRAGEDIRAGRWWWEDPEHKECGLHR